MDLLPPALYWWIFGKFAFTWDFLLWLELFAWEHEAPDNARGIEYLELQRNTVTNKITSVSQETSGFLGIANAWSICLSF